MKYLILSACLFMAAWYNYGQKLDYYMKDYSGDKEVWKFVSAQKFTERDLTLNENKQRYAPSAELVEEEQYWSLINPYPTNGFLVSICSDNNFIITTGISINFLTGLSPAGLFTSTDNGNHWKETDFGTDTIIIDLEMKGETIWCTGANFYTSDLILLKSTDRGENWESKHLPDLSNYANDPVYCKFFNENEGLISILYSGVGTQLPLFKTTDGGETWETLNMVFPAMIKNEKIFFMNPNYAWLGFREPSQPETLQLAHTSNSGLDWRIQYSDSAEELKCMYFPDEMHGWLVYEQFNYPVKHLKICSTSDGGESWNTQKIIEGDMYDIFGCKMFAADSMNVWIGYTTNFDIPLKILKTTDGGINWEEFQAVNATDIQLGDIEFENLNSGWIVSSMGTILHTTNGGSVWERKNTIVTSALLQGVDFIDQTYGIAAGGDDDINGCGAVILNTTDGGERWGVLLCDSNFAFTDVDMIDRNTILALASSYSLYNSSYIYRTTNEGAAWSISEFDTLMLRSAQTVDSKAWIVGTTVSYNPAIIFSSDAGGTWVPQTNINVAGTGLNEACFTDQLTGYAVGNNGVVLKTTDGGEAWLSCWGNLDPNDFWRFYTLTSVYFINNTTGWISGTISGYSNKIIKTTNGGQTWDTLSINAYGRLFFIDSGNGWIFSDLVWRTGDGGETWEALASPNGIYSADFVDAKHGWAVGSGEEILNTSIIL